MGRLDAANRQADTSHGKNAKYWNCHSSRHSGCGIPEAALLKINVELSDGYTLEGSMKKPKAKALNSTGTTTLEGDVMFQQRIDGTGKGKAKVTISFQCCYDHVCLPPQDIVLELDI